MPREICGVQVRVVMRIGWAGSDEGLLGSPAGCRCQDQVILHVCDGGDKSELDNDEGEVMMMMMIFMTMADCDSTWRV